MAVYGLACVFLYIVPAIVFLLPQSLVADELASGWSGGVFRWVSEGMSAKWGMLAVWCQFAMTIFYYPTLLAFVASTFAYIIDPSLASNGVYTGIVTLTGNVPLDTIIWTIFAIVYQQFENYFIQPRIQSHQVQLDPFIVVVAALFGAALYGIPGALLAIPVAGAIQVAIGAYFEYRRLMAAAGEQAEITPTG